MDFAAMKPADLRGLIRKGELTGPTTGMCNGYAQGNLVVLPKALAWDFLLFCQRNPKACPLLEVADAGERTFAQFGKGSDIATDIPRYRVYEHGELTGEYTDVSKFFEERPMISVDMMILYAHSLAFLTLMNFPQEWMITAICRSSRSLLPIL